jgi:hypothetical protein
MAKEINSEENDKLEKELLDKEFVFDQWRKLLCYFVVDGDISIEGSDLREKLTAEQVRTVFNHGFKLALLQSKESILNELSKSSNDNKSINEILNCLAVEIDERISVSNCYKNLNRKDNLMLSQAIKRETEFNDKYWADSFSSWGSKKM